MHITRQLALLYLAVILFVIAFLIAVNAITGNFPAFLAAGLFCAEASRIP